MDNDLMLKYLELSKEYFNLCFKFKDKDAFVLGIVTNEGAICFNISSDLYDKFNIKELFSCYRFSSYKIGDNKSLDNLSLADVNYFDIKGDTLEYYFGNSEEVIIPKGIKNIKSYAFSFNDKIKCVKAEDVESISYYAFRNNLNLEVLDFPKVKSVGNLLRVPNLRELNINIGLNSFSMEDTIRNDMKISVSDGVNSFVFSHDDSLLDELFEKIDAYSDDGDVYSVSCIIGNQGRYRFVKSSKRDQYNEYFTGICKALMYFKKVPDSVKEVILINNYACYFINDLSVGGLCDRNSHVILYDYDNLSTSFFHEIGHALDFCYVDISSKNEFLDIYYEEKDLLYTKTFGRKRWILNKEFINHMQSNSSEYFAECFQRYFDKDEYFMLECPKSFSFIDNFVKELNNSKRLILK